MGADAFGEWLNPALELPLGGGRTVLVPPPSVADAKKVLALTIQAEIALGIVKPERTLPRSITKLIAEVAENDEHPALGEQYAVLEQHLQERMLPRVEVYAIFYWAKGKAYADALATLLWTERDQSDATAELEAERRELVTAEDWAPYGVGTADAEGWFPQYRTPPSHLRPAGPDAAEASTQEEQGEVPWADIVDHWPLVVADLNARHRINLLDPATLALPWTEVRPYILDLLDAPTRLREATTRR